MSIVRLITDNFRNLSSSAINFHPELNLFVGDNGSGKSSLLEALFFLGHGKSFRTSKAEHLSNYNSDSFVVSLKDSNNLQFGLSKNFSSGLTQIRINGERHNRLSTLVKNIAIQIVTPESFKLFFGGPKERRRFIDLGMFHVKHDFSHQWTDFSRILKQRNACIRKQVDYSTLAYWTELFCLHSRSIAEIREDYVNEIRNELNVFLRLLLPELANKVSMQYSRGWPQKKELSQVLSQSIEKEASFGYSVYGPHKFDVKFLLGKNTLESQLSRGQQKLFLLALTFAQSKLIARINRVKPILLIDDIGAELDNTSRTILSDTIGVLNCQVVITAIDENVLTPFMREGLRSVNDDFDNNYKLFHVKHGEITEALYE